MSESECMVATPLGRVAICVSGDLDAKSVPVIMWPSLMMDHTLWSHQVAFLAGRVPTVSIDPPGHGRSEALRRDFVLEECVDVVEAILDYLGVRSAHLVGNSWGAMTSALFGAMLPQRTASLVLIAGTAGTASIRQRLEFGVLITTARALGGIPSFLMDRVERNFFAPGIDERNPEAVQELDASIERCNIASVAHAVRSVVVHRIDYHELLCKVTAPTLVISGEYDSVFPPEDGKRMHAAIPGSRFVVVEDGAHLLAAEVPDTINALLCEHLAKNKVLRD